MCSMDRRRGRIRWILAQQAIRVFLLLSIILTLIIMRLVDVSLDTSHLNRQPYSQSIHQATAGQQQVYQETTAALKGPHNEHKSGEVIDQLADLDDTCPVFKLMSSRNTSETVTCKRADFVPGSCRIMKTLFTSEPENCSHQTMNIICEIKEYNPKKPEVRCHHDVCRIFSKVSVGLYHSEIGNYTLYKLNSTQELESFINSKLLIDFQDHYSHKGYCVIQCTNRDGKFVSQLLVLPPVFSNISEEQFRKKLGGNPPLNVNILLLDSVSRHHFYRTLPKTIKEFRRLNKYHFKNGRVFDFELLQGIKGRTYESLQALFGGEISSLPMFDSFELPPKPINLNETFGKFKTYGYETLYMEDMCWLGEWGLVKEQRAMNLSAPFPERLKFFNEAVHRAGIDRLDVSYSSCLILQENKVRDVFHGPPSICYNGIHQHTYLLQYIEYFLSRFSSFYKPTFTFLILDTGHEDTGIRIKQVDDHLARHVSFLAHQSKTISFILSDHGNTYGRFIHETPESHLEIFHPFLFVIVPDQASEILGDDKMKSLFINQHRLVSLIDVHYTIKGLLPVKEQAWGKFPKYNINIDGLLSPVSISRTCKDIPRIHPNLCICQSSYTLEKNNSYYALFAEFALGSINREIADMQIGNSKHTCPILVATRFDNVRRSAQDGEVFILLDLYVKSSSIVDYSEERFLVSILYSSDIHREGLLFLGFSRLTPYSIYKQCADPTFDIRLCICERKNVFGNKNNKQDRDEYVLWTRTFRSLVHKPCLYILTRNYTAGVVLSIQNICPDMQYNIRFNFLSRNMHSSNKMPVSQVIRPKMVESLVVGIIKVQDQPWNFKYTLHFKSFPISG